MVNSNWPAIYTCGNKLPSMVLIMTYRLFGAKPFSNAIPNYRLLSIRSKRILVRRNFILKKKIIWNVHLQNDTHFVSASMCAKSHNVWFWGRMSKKQPVLSCHGDMHNSACQRGVNSLAFGSRRGDILKWWQRLLGCKESKSRARFDAKNAVSFFPHRTRIITVTS